MVELLGEHKIEIEGVFKTLATAKHELAGALEQCRLQTEEIASNEKCLADAQKDEQGVTPPFVKNCTLRPEFARGIGVYPGRLDLRWPAPLSHIEPC
jgi:hypothetical protein